MTSDKPLSHDVRMTGFVARKTFEEVRNYIQQSVEPGEKEQIDLRDALGRVLSEDVVSRVDVPYFDRSAMDGFAVRAEETSGASSYNPLEFTIVGQSYPGNAFEGGVGSGQAVKIMTGGAIPDGATGVVPAEYVESDGAVVKVREQVPPGKHIMRRGEDVKEGDVVIPAGRALRPQDLGVLASVHYPSVPCYRQPTVAVIITGNELVEPGHEAAGTKIVDSNSHVIAGLVRRYGGVPVFKGIIPDKYETIRQTIESSQEDMIVISGGTSVGEEDYAPIIVNELGEVVVHGVAIRPGSPFGMGRIGSQPVFLVPGSPVAAMVTTDAFVGSAIRRRLGQDVGFNYLKTRGRLRQKVISRIGRTEFVRVKVFDDGTVEKLRVSGASMLTSTTRADGFFLVDEELEGYPEGTEVEVYVYSTA